MVQVISICEEDIYIYIFYIKVHNNYQIKNTKISITQLS